MKVLVIQQRPGIGDLVIFLSFIRKIVSKFNSPVSILVKTNSKADEILKNDKPLIDKIISSPIGKNCISFENLSISEILPIIKNCDFYLGNDTGFLHLSCALGLQCIAIFFNSPVLSYGTYAANITCIIPKGETMETVIHDLKLGRERISVEDVYNKAKELLN